MKDGSTTKVSTNEIQFAAFFQQRLADLVGGQILHANFIVPGQLQMQATAASGVGLLIKGK